MPADTVRDERHLEAGREVPVENSTGMSSSERTGPRPSRTAVDLRAGDVEAGYVYCRTIRVETRRHLEAEIPVRNSTGMSNSGADTAPASVSKAGRPPSTVMSKPAYVFGRYGERQHLKLRFPLRKFDRDRVVLFGETRRPRPSRTAGRPPSRSCQSRHVIAGRSGEHQRHLEAEIPAEIQDTKRNSRLTAETPAPASSPKQLHRLVRPSTPASLSQDLSNNKPKITDATHTSSFHLGSTSQIPRLTRPI